jgi:hypothetical protein
MTPMFKYPQGEGRMKAAYASQLPPKSIRFNRLFMPYPLLSRFVTRSLRLQTHVYKGV